MISNHTMMLDEALQDKLNQNETVELILTDVFEALETKGYNPINQVVGYLISGDPAYISSYQGARNKIQQIERDEIIEVLLEKFIESKKMKTLGLDLGTRTLGIAISDALGMMAHGVETFRLKRIIIKSNSTRSTTSQNTHVSKIVLGLPKT